MELTPSGPMMDDMAGSYEEEFYQNEHGRFDTFESEDHRGADDQDGFCGVSRFGQGTICAAPSEVTVACKPLSLLIRAQLRGFYGQGICVQHQAR
jgi:hypothetical protein